MDRIDMIKNRLRLDPVLSQELFLAIGKCKTWTEVKKCAIIKAFIKAMKNDMPEYNTERYLKTIFEMKEVLLDECETE